MSFPATEEDARAQGYSFAYRTTYLFCDAPIRFFKTPKGNFIAVDAGRKFERHNCLGASAEAEMLGKAAS
jgi:hypothetical protein